MCLPPMTVPAADGSQLSERRAARSAPPYRTARAAAARPISVQLGAYTFVKGFVLLLETARWICCLSAEACWRWTTATFWSPTTPPPGSRFRTFARLLRACLCVWRRTTLPCARCRWVLLCPNAPARPGFVSFGLYLVEYSGAA